MAPAEQRPFQVLGPAEPRLPVVIAVPHAGRDYPAALLAGSRLPVAALAALEDRLVDLLLPPSLDAGAVAIVARRARAWIDLNRDPREIDRDLVTPPPARNAVLVTSKLRAGLGLIPRRIAGQGEIARGPIADTVLQARVATDHEPYHRALGDMLERTRRRFGRAVLVDCHSMPPLGAGRAQLVVGDRQGLSASGAAIATALEAARASGLRVARNAPYAGGYTLDRHGQPWRGIDAIQLEFDRALYLAPGLMAAGEGMAATGAILAAVVEALAAPPAQALAAE
jgi:N-formylglutamate amidohydrolase